MVVTREYEPGGVTGGSNEGSKGGGRGGRIIERERDEKKGGGADCRN